MNSTQRLLTAVSILTVVSTWSAPAWSLGLGRPESQAVLGETLRVVVPLRVEVGETVTQECVSAEVMFGDDRVPSAAVSVELQPAETVTAGMGARLVLRTTALVNEPVVTVQVNAGCQARIGRRFVALADPPGHRAAEVAPVVEAMQAPLPVEPVGKPSAGGKAKRADAQRSSHRAPVVASADAPRRAAAKPRKEAQARSKPHAQPAPESPRLALDPIDADALVQPSLRSSGDMVSPVEGASSEVQARREAASALWRALNATPEDMLRQRQHVEQLEQRLHALQRSGEQTQQNVSALQARMQALEKPRSSGVSWPMALAVFAGMAVFGWVLHGWGVRKGRQQGANWWAPEAGELPLNLPDHEDTHSKPHLDEVDDLLGPVPEPDEEDRLPAFAAAPTTPVAAAQAAGQRVEMGGAPSSSLAPQPNLVAPEALKAVSVEELIDLEQQAEFFIVLGQDEAAIELLEAHLGGHTQEIPWPYLKLMEIYRRLGRRADYERVQARFNAHFNGHAPTWESDMEQGRSLVDYPGVIERVQALWAEPARAMDVLEMSLVHLGPDADAFDLPAYRELLFLYAVARDLSDRIERRHPASTEISPLTATQPVRPANLAAPAVEPLSVDLDLDRLDNER